MNEHSRKTPILQLDAATKLCYSGSMQALETLTNATLTRKQFLFVIASLVLGIIGIKQLFSIGKPQRTSTGFGGGVYGR